MKLMNHLLTLAVSIGLLILSANHAVSENSKTLKSGLADPRFQNYVTAWLADDDRTALIGMALLARKGNIAAQMFLWQLERSRGHLIANDWAARLSDGDYYRIFQPYDDPDAETWLDVAKRHDRNVCKFQYSFCVGHSDTIENLFSISENAKASALWISELQFGITPERNTTLVEKFQNKIPRHFEFLRQITLHYTNIGEYDHNYFEDHFQSIGFDKWDTIEQLNDLASFHPFIEFGRISTEHASRKFETTFPKFYDLLVRFGGITGSIGKSKYYFDERLASYIQGKLSIFDFNDFHKMKNLSESEIMAIRKNIERMFSDTQRIRKMTVEFMNEYPDFKFIKDLCESTCSHSLHQCLGYWYLVIDGEQLFEASYHMHSSPVEFATGQKRFMESKKHARHIEHRVRNIITWSEQKEVDELRSIRGPECVKVQWSEMKRQFPGKRQDDELEEFLPLGTNL